MTHPFTPPVMYVLTTATLQGKTATIGVFDSVERDIEALPPEFKDRAPKSSYGSASAPILWYEVGPLGASITPYRLNLAYQVEV